ncbi:unnamed protein product [Candida verbasci]|uniref:Glycoside hydrolase family 5 domain-containing protein n=1 Tax=Candida verbasci TaxID=1227364 RepID=A0A9W4TVB5_9ASCO|nr:unnamed protein product [Candida verbasci]
MVFDKLRLKKRASSIPDAGPVAELGKEPSTKQIYQSRENFGVCFGSSFVLERWIFDDLFSETNGETEYDAVSSLVSKFGADQARTKFENHWKNYINDDDWNWLSSHQVKSIRLPIGYWDVDGGSFAKGYDFEKFASVYSNAWSIIKQNYIEPAANYQISILIDVHALPAGGANSNAHSGIPNANGGFFKDTSAQINMAKMMGWIANDLKNYDNIAGIQVVNEAEFDESTKAPSTYYGAAISEIRKYDDSIPVYISDGWWPDQWAKWVQSEQGSDGYIGVVVDDHVYRCFSDSDKSKSADQIINDLNGDVLTNISDNSNGVDFIVGEYSCVLDQQTWDKGGNRDELVKKFGNTQSQLFDQRASGSYFWTFKFQSGNGGEWDFKTMTNAGAIIPPQQVNSPNQNEFQQKLNEAYNNHVNYWKSQGGSYDFDRFKAGYTQAFTDGATFSKFNSRLGRRQAWKRSRSNDYVQSKGNSNNQWEYDQGFDEGLKDYYGY